MAVTFILRYRQRHTSSISYGNFVNATDFELTPTQVNDFQTIGTELPHCV